MGIPRGNGFYIVDGDEDSLRINPEYVPVPLEGHDCIRESGVAGFLVVNSPADLGEVASRFGGVFRPDDIPAIEEFLDGKDARYVSRDDLERDGC